MDVLANLVDKGWKYFDQPDPTKPILSIAKYFVTGRLFTRSEQQTKVLSESRLVKLFLCLENQEKALRKGLQPGAVSQSRVLGKHYALLHKLGKPPVLASEQEFDPMREIKEVCQGVLKSKGLS